MGFDFDVSWIAVLVAAFAKMVMGMVWFHPKLFGEARMNALGEVCETKDPVTGEKKCCGPCAKSLILSALVALLTAYVLALFINWTASETSWDGAVIGFFAALGFMVTSNLSQVIWSKKPLEVFYIDSGYALVALTIMGALIGLIGY